MNDQNKDQPTNLIVLTRNELITEIEKMPRSYADDCTEIQSHPKCHCCQRLTRVKGGAA